MGVHSSLKITRSKAMELVSAAMSDDRDLKDMVNVIMTEHSFFNCSGIVEDGEENDDDRLANSALGYDRNRRMSE